MYKKLRQCLICPRLNRVCTHRLRNHLVTDVSQLTNQALDDEEIKRSTQVEKHLILRSKYGLKTDISVEHDERSQGGKRFTSQRYRDRPGKETQIQIGKFKRRKNSLERLAEINGIENQMSCISGQCKFAQSRQYQIQDYRAESPLMAECPEPDQNQKREERKRLEEERRDLEQKKRRLDEERKRLDEDRRRLEIELKMPLVDRQSESHKNFVLNNRCYLKNTIEYEEERQKFKLSLKNNFINSAEMQGSKNTQNTCSALNQHSVSMLEAAHSPSCPHSHLYVFKEPSHQRLSKENIRQKKVGELALVPSPTKNPINDPPHLDSQENHQASHHLNSSSYNSNPQFPKKHSPHSFINPPSRKIPNFNINPYLDSSYLLGTDQRQPSHSLPKGAPEVGLKDKMGLKNLGRRGIFSQTRIEPAQQNSVRAPKKRSIAANQQTSSKQIEPLTPAELRMALQRRQYTRYLRI